MSDLLTVQVEDARASIVHGQFTIPISNPLSISPAPLPNAQVGVAYSAPLTYLGGTAPYIETIIDQSAGNTWSISGGNVVGTPTTAGTFYINVLIVDANEVPQNQVLTIIVAPASSGGGAAVVQKFVPGYYVQTSGQTGLNTAELSVLAPYMPGTIKGYGISYPWSLFHTGLNTFNFSKYDSDFAALQASAPGAYFVPMIRWFKITGSINATDVSTYNPNGDCVPAFILSNPSTYGSGPPGSEWGGWNANGYGGSAFGYDEANMWTPAIYQQYLAFHAAFMAHVRPGQSYTVDEDPLVPIIFDWTPTDLNLQGNPSGTTPSSFSVTAWKNAWLALTDPMTGVAAQYDYTPVAQMPMFGGNGNGGSESPSDQGLIVTNMSEGPTSAMSCTDITGQIVGTPSDASYGQWAFMGNTYSGSTPVTGGGTDRRKQMLSAPTIQGDDINGPSGPYEPGSYPSSTTAQLVTLATALANFATSSSGLNASIVMMPYATAKFLSTDFSNIILPAIEAANAVNTLLPLNYMNAPGGLTVTGTTSSTVSLSWTLQSQYTGTGLTYTIYRNGTAVGTGLTSGTYTDTGLAASTTYVYKVAVANSNGTGPQSAGVSGTTTS